jgi:predicted AlkP superfamily phosphohydrolase/phosphomutase
MHPTILIGLDGATFGILDDLIADGHMPALGALLARGARAGLLSTAHPLTPPAWTTLMTGRTPGQHGVFDFVKCVVRGGTAFFTLNNFADIRCETIWAIVSRLRGRVLSLNFPLMAPPPKVAGAIVPGLLSWRHLRRNVFPREVYQELQALPDFDPRELSWDFENEKKALQNMPDEELEPWTRFHITRERRWFQVLNRLWDRGPYDLTAVLFDGVDKLQHGCWRFLDPAFLPTRPTAFEARMRQLCLEYFRNLDGFIGAIVDRAGPDARVLLASDHGFGPNHAIFRVNKWLEQVGCLHWSADAVPRTGVAPLLQLDWERTTAYAPSAATNGIHIRVRRAPGEPGVAPEEYDAFRARLTEQLLRLREPGGGALVRRVLAREEAFPGDYQDGAPDLTLVLYDHGFVSVLDAEPIVVARPAVTGTHYPEGVLMACGPGIRRGQALPRQSILDTAPTLLYSLGLPIPADFEGRVIEDLFEPDYLRRHPVRLGPPTEPPGADPGNGPGLDAKEEGKIYSRLAALGYVE